MHAADRSEFERNLGRLCAAFDTPLTQPRVDAYWTAFGKISLARFARLVEIALTEAQFESMPTVGALRKLGEVRGESRAATEGSQCPLLQEQLSEFVMITRFPSGLDDKFAREQMRQTSQPWTYLYREWQDEKGHRCAEVTGVYVPPFGSLAGFRVMVADMLADLAHARVMAKLSFSAAQPASTARQKWIERVLP